MTKTSFTPVSITETATLTAVVTTTRTLLTTATVQPAAAPPPRYTVPASPRLTGTVTVIAPNTNRPAKGKTGTIIQTEPGITGTTTVTNPGSHSPPSHGVTKAVDRLRLAAGTAGVAVTSAAGLGFLLLRRRGRYGS